MYVKMLKITYNPFGIKENSSKSSYKHTFPSGICNDLKMRHKADNSVNLNVFVSKLNFNVYICI